MIATSDSSLLSSCGLPANVINSTIIKFVLNLDYSVFSQKKDYTAAGKFVFMTENQHYEYSTTCVFLDILRTAVLLNTYEQLFLPSMSQRNI